ncbi:hypothetical protein EVAR_96195_1 [Eumeta japonica]|uniref:Uncharacterized protein n=1 Tax=Eumeta variegata TaxID=151549 RepID=A0A4C1VJ24_EUMVA|nr:hypothetical protein EVAR_96195_1 [Eumeta japonica]
MVRYRLRHFPNSGVLHTTEALKHLKRALVEARHLGPEFLVRRQMYGVNKISGDGAIVKAPASDAGNAQRCPRSRIGDHLFRLTHLNIGHRLFKGEGKRRDEA